MLQLILLVAAFILFLIEAFLPWAYRTAPAAWARPHLGWLGLAFWVLSILLGQAHV